MGNVFEVKEGSNYHFAIKANGSIIATSGEIGGWRINPGMGLERTISASDSPDGKKYDTVIRSNPWGWNSSTNSFSPNNDNSNFGNGYAFAVYKSDSPLFYVNYKGELYSKTGSIGGWTISSDGLKKEQIINNTSYFAKLLSNPTSNTSRAIEIGSGSTPDFYV
jgi:hypothetical protein